MRDLKCLSTASHTLAQRRLIKTIAADALCLVEMLVPYVNKHAVKQQLIKAKKKKNQASSQFFIYGMMSEKINYGDKL